jgi:hypothetical protein
VNEKFTKTEKQQVDMFTDFYRMKLYNIT